MEYLEEEYLQTEDARDGHRLRFRTRPRRKLVPIKLLINRKPAIPEPVGCYHSLTMFGDLPKGFQPQQVERLTPLTAYKYFPLGDGITCLGESFSRGDLFLLKSFNFPVDRSSLYIHIEL